MHTESLLPDADTKLISGPVGRYWVVPTPKAAKRLRQRGYSNVITAKTARKWFPGLCFCQS
jgi:hypothetical protein